MIWIHNHAVQSSRQRQCTVPWTAMLYLPADLQHCPWIPVGFYIRHQGQLAYHLFSQDVPSICPHACSPGKEWPKVFVVTDLSVGQSVQKHPPIFLAWEARLHSICILCIPWAGVYGKGFVYYMRYIQRNCLHPSVPMQRVSPAKRFVLLSAKHLSSLLFPLRFLPKMTSLEDIHPPDRPVSGYSPHHNSVLPYGIWEFGLYKPVVHYYYQVTTVRLFDLENVVTILIA